jgi:hypothetical protein
VVREIQGMTDSVAYAGHKRALRTKARKKYEQTERAIEVILQYPEKSRKDQAALIGLSPEVFSNLIKDPDFENIRQERVAQIIDPALRETLEQSLLAVSVKAARVVDEKLDIEPTIHDALSTLKVTTQALGMANRKETPTVQTNIQIAWLPSK